MHCMSVTVYTLTAKPGTLLTTYPTFWCIMSSEPSHHGDEMRDHSTSHKVLLQRKPYSHLLQLVNLYLLVAHPEFSVFCLKSPDFSSLFKIPWLFPDWKKFDHFSRISNPWAHVTLICMQRIESGCQKVSLDSRLTFSYLKHLSFSKIQTELANKVN